MITTWAVLLIKFEFLTLQIHLLTLTKSSYARLQSAHLRPEPLTSSIDKSAKTAFT